MNGNSLTDQVIRPENALKFSIIHIQNNNEETLFGLDEAYAT